MFNNHLCVEPGDEARKEPKTKAVLDVHWKSVVDIGVQPKHLAGTHVHKTHLYYGYIHSVSVQVVMKK